MENSTADLRIAVLGNVDSGKSTLVGVLTKFCFDDGRGSARSHVLHHKHEKERGQSSSVVVELMGYDSSGNSVVPSRHHQHQQQQQPHTKQVREVALKSTKLVSIIDLCGHEHFLKTTVFGLMGMAPDLVLLVVGANAGVQKMTREHLGLAAALQLPVVVVVTKIDMAPEQILEDSLKRVDRVLRLANRKKFQVKSDEDAVSAAQAMSSGNVAPVFQLSCINGQGVDLLRRFLQELACGANNLAGQGIRNTGSSAKEEESKEEDPGMDCEIQVDNTFNVPGVGTVLSGSVFHGQVHVGSKLLLGPDNLGQFREVRIQSIHRQCVSVEKCFVGQQCTVAIKFAVRTQALPRNKIRKGMVLLSPERMERLQQDGGVVAVHSFEARVRILHHTTTIQEGYMPILHLGTVRQSAQIEKITFDNDGEEGVDHVLRTGGEAVVRFRFAYHPEFVTVGRALVFREGTTKGVGKVIRLVE